MQFVEILGSKSKQQNYKNFNEIALIVRQWMSKNDISNCRWH